MLIQTVRDDVVFSGHGSTLPAAGKVTRVPAGVEFYLLAPPGAGITNRLGQALERGERITELYIRSSVTKQFSPHRHAVYTSATGDVPNMALQPPRGLDISGNIVPHVIGVERNTDLHDLWARARPFIDPRGTTRVFWAECSSIKAGGNPCVDLQAD
jgi:hypothetical protein